MVIIRCNCGERLKADEESAGLKIICPKCESSHLIPHPEKSQEDDAAEPKKKKLIMLIDSSKTNRMALRRLLEYNNYTAVEIENGNTCLQTVERTNPDLIIMDIDMSDMDGVLCLGKLRLKESTANIPVIVYTKRTSKDDIIKCRKLSAIDYIIKPLHLEGLLDKIKNVLQD